MAVLRMSEPYLRNSVWWLRVAVPRSLREKAKGRQLDVRIGDDQRSLKVGERISTSLWTSDKAQARQRASQVRIQVELFFDSLRGDREPLTFKQRLAFNGEVRKEVISHYDDDPGDPATWEALESIATRLASGDLVAWGRGSDGTPVELPKDDALLSHYAPAIARVEAKHGVFLTDGEKVELIKDLLPAMMDAARVNRQKASGDYSDDGTTNRYPKLNVAPPPVKAADETLKWAFNAVIDREVARRSVGTDARPLSKAAISKYRLHCARFAKHRGSEDVRTVTAQQGQDWVDALGADEANPMSNKVRGEHLTNVKVVVNYARSESLGAVFPGGNPLDLVTRPKFKPKPRGARTLTIEEAQTILKATRKVTGRPHIRFIPWLMAYSGARIGEVSMLRKDDFIELDGMWFYQVIDKGEGSAKTDASIRTIPVHPALEKEGLMAFVEGCGSGPLFCKSADSLLRKWVREVAGVTREEVAPNHGWRHLFTDFARIHIEGDAAHRALVGRADSGSMGMYGNSQAMWPTLWKKMAAIAPIKLD